MAKRPTPRRHAGLPTGGSSLAIQQLSSPAIAPPVVPPPARRIPAPTGTQPIALPVGTQPFEARPALAPLVHAAFLARIAYASAMSSELSRPQLDALMSTWRRQNASRGITGFVAVHGARVFQVLEGFPDVVAAVYEAIARDPRHRIVAKLIDEPIKTRGFGDWSMGQIRSAARGQAPVVERTPTPAGARALVAELTTGSWRRSIV
jgi:hypothetical protein